MPLPSASFFFFFFFPGGCFMPKPPLWSLYPCYFFFCSHHPFLPFPTGELTDTGNKKPNCDRKINDYNLLVLPFTGLGTKSSCSIFDVFVITKHRWGPAASMLCTRFKGRTLGTKWKKKKKKSRSRKGQRQHTGAGWRALTSSWPQFPHLQNGQKQSFTEQFEVKYRFSRTVPGIR